MFLIKKQKVEKLGNVKDFLYSGHSLNKLIHQPEIKALYNLRRR